MAANAAAGGSGGEMEVNMRLQREYDQLRRKYVSLETAYKQAVGRLEMAEAKNRESDRRHEMELNDVSGRIREKIQALEIRQVRNTDDMEEFKQQLKRELYQHYEQAVDELLTDLEHERRAYADLCLQHSILKSEFQSSQQLTIDLKEKSQLKLANQASEFESERVAMQARIEQLSTELGNVRTQTAINGDSNVNDGLLKRLQGDVDEWRKKFARFEGESERKWKLKERELEELQDQLDEKKSEIQTSSTVVQRIEAELMEERQKRKLVDERYSRVYHEMLQLRDGQETFKRNAEIELEELKAQFAQERAQLQKQRDENLLKAEDLDRRVSDMKELLAKSETAHRDTQTRMNQMENNLKRGMEKDRDAWRDERIALEAKIRELEYKRQDDERKSREKFQALMLDLKRTTWEKEKLTEELARIQIANAEEKGQSKNTAQLEITEVSKRLVEQEQKFSELSKDLERSRHNQDQFRRILDLVGTQMERTTTVVNDRTDVQSIVDDLKDKINSMLVPPSARNENKAQGESSRGNRADRSSGPKGSSQKVK